MDKRTRPAATGPVNSQRWRLIFRRIAAYLIDLAMLFTFYVAVQSLLFPPLLRHYEAAFAANGWLLELYVLSTISLPVWLYFILSERSRWQGTAGKRLLRLRVTAVSAATLTTSQIIMRTAGKFLPWEVAHFAVNVPANPWLNPTTVFSSWRLLLIGLSYLLLAVYVIALVRQPHQTLYDHLAQTAVMPAPAENRL